MNLSFKPLISAPVGAIENKQTNSLLLSIAKVMNWKRYLILLVIFQVIFK